MSWIMYFNFFCRWSLSNFWSMKFLSIWSIEYIFESTTFTSNCSSIDIHSFDERFIVASSFFQKLRKTFAIEIICCAMLWMSYIVISINITYFWLNWLCWLLSTFNVETLLKTAAWLIDLTKLKIKNEKMTTISMKTAISTKATTFNFKTRLFYDFVAKWRTFELAK